MLKLTIDDLEEMRFKLIAAVVTEELQGEAAELAKLIARDLDGLAAHFENDGFTFTKPAISSLCQYLEAGSKALAR